MKILKINQFMWRIYCLLIFVLPFQLIFCENITQLLISANVGETVALSKNYETATLIQSIIDEDKSISAVFKGHYINDSSWAANGGVLLRRSFNQKVVGINFFYDTLTDPKVYQQVGVGAELFHKQQTIRCNFYIPIGRKPQCTQFDEFCYPGGYRVFYKEKKIALSGADIEYAKELTLFGYRNEIGIGCYGYLPNKTKSRAGGTIRVTSALGSYWKLQVLGTYDSRCNALIQGTITFGIPFSNSQKLESPYNQLPQRQDIIVRGFYKYPWCKNY